MSDMHNEHENDAVNPLPPSAFRRADIPAEDAPAPSDPEAVDPSAGAIDAEPKAPVLSEPVPSETVLSEPGPDEVDAVDMQSADDAAGAEDAAPVPSDQHVPDDAYATEEALRGDLADQFDAGDAGDGLSALDFESEMLELAATTRTSPAAAADTPLASTDTVDEIDDDGAAAAEEPLAEHGPPAIDSPPEDAGAVGVDDAVDEIDGDVSDGEAPEGDVAVVAEAAHDAAEMDETSEPCAPEIEAEVEAEGDVGVDVAVAAGAGEAMSSAAELESYLADELGAMARECDRLRAAVAASDTAAAGSLGNELAVATGRLAMFFGQDRLAEIGAALQTAARGAAPHIEGEAAEGVTQRIALLASLLASADHVAVLDRWNLSLLRERINACIAGSVAHDEGVGLADLEALYTHDEVLAGMPDLSCPAAFDPAAVAPELDSMEADADLEDDGETTAAIEAESPPAMPQTPDATEVASDAQSLGEPQMLDVSQMPDMPTAPAMPDMPDMPDMPEMPEMPGMPDMPGAPSMPGMPDAADDWGSAPLMLPPADIEKLLAAIPRVRAIAEEIDPILNDASDFTGRAEAAPKLVAAGERVASIAGDFNLSTLCGLGELVARTGGRLGGVGSRSDDIPDALLPELFLRLRTIAELFDQYCAALEVGMELKWPLETMRRRIDLMLSGKFLHPELVEWHRGEIDRVIELDGITEGVEPLPTPPTEVGEGPAAGAAAVGMKKPTEETIRMSRTRLEEMLDLVRQLVLNKNQVYSLAERARVGSLDGLAGEQLGTRAAEYARLVGRLQESLSDARFQPIGMALERFERPVRDVAQLNDREANLTITGGSTGIDKFVLDAIAEPIGRMLRFVAGHHIEPASVREAAGKPTAGSVHVSAIDLGTHILIRIEDDGYGSTDERLRERASVFDHVEPGELDAMPTEALALLAFESWHADSDLAGVAEQVRAAGGSLRVSHAEGRGTTIEVLSPIRGAVIDAMRVEIGGEIYAVPVRAVVRIVRERDVDVHTIGQSAAARISGGVVPVVDCHASLGAQEASADPALVVVAVDGRSVALRVDKVLGDQEVVIDQTGLADDEQGPFLGATIEDDGRVAFVIDVDRLSRLHQHGDEADQPDGAFAGDVTSAEAA